MILFVSSKIGPDYLARQKSNFDWKSGEHDGIMYDSAEVKEQDIIGGIGRKNNGKCYP